MIPDVMKHILCDKCYCLCMHIQMLMFIYVFQCDYITKKADDQVASIPLSNGTIINEYIVHGTSSRLKNSPCINLKVLIDHYQYIKLYNVTSYSENNPCFKSNKKKSGSLWTYLYVSICTHIYFYAY